MGAPSKLPGQPQNNRIPGKAGRPTVYTDEIGRIVCNAVAQGRSVRSVCRERPDHLPKDTVVYGWIAENRFPAFSRNYARACLVRDARFADTLIEDIDDPGPMVETRRETKNGGQIVERRLDLAWAGQQRVRLQARQWWLARRDPKRWGDYVHVHQKHEVEHRHVHSVEAPEWLKMAVASQPQQLIEAQAVVVGEEGATQQPQESRKTAKDDLS